MCLYDMDEADDVCRTLNIETSLCLSQVMEVE